MTRRTAFAFVLSLGLLAAARPAGAQGFISPLIGFNFGGDAGCATATNCQDKNLNLGVSFGSLGTIFGFEEEVAYAKDFFGASPGLSSNVLTVMSNVMLAPDLKVFRPYALAGVGLMKSHAELTSTNLLSTDNNAFGWDVGGGLMVFLTQNVGLRGDIRYFHAFQNLDLAGITISDTKLDFGRAAAAIVFKF
jgi:opacity protein-like surface antigen